MNTVNVVEITWKTIDAVENVLKRENIDLTSDLGIMLMRRTANALISLASSAETLEIS